MSSCSILSRREKNSLPRNSAIATLCKDAFIFPPLDSYLCRLLPYGNRLPMKKSALILKNALAEGPGTIGDFLDKGGFSQRIVELGAGESPPPLEGFGFLIVLGGPMGVYEMKEHPHLQVAERLITEAINREMNVLGVCLGSQLIAHCLGAEVYKGSKGTEIGWLPIELTGEGVKDQLMRKLAVHPVAGDFWRRFKVFQWHGDTFNIPAGAERLARSELYENQAFRYKEHVYAFQFHIEVTKEIVKGWLNDEPDNLAVAMSDEKIYDECMGRAESFYGAFFAA